MTVATVEDYPFNTAARAGASLHLLHRRSGLAFAAERSPELVWPAPVFTHLRRCFRIGWVPNNTTSTTLVVGRTGQSMQRTPTASRDCICANSGDSSRRPSPGYDRGGDPFQQGPVGHSGEGEHWLRRETERHSRVKANSNRSEETLAGSEAEEGTPRIGVQRKGAAAPFAPASVL